MPFKQNNYAKGNSWIPQVVGANQDRPYGTNNLRYNIERDGEIFDVNFTGFMKNEFSGDQSPTIVNRFRLHPDFIEEPTKICSSDTTHCFDVIFYK